jgi:hypothetical protein
MNVEEPEVIAPEITSIELYPPDSWRQDIPDTVDVFLPGKVRKPPSFFHTAFDNSAGCVGCY